MARAQVCRFYDDATSSGAVRRSVKRLPDFHTPSGLFYTTKSRRVSSPSWQLLLLPRNLFLQLLAFLAFLFFIFSSSSSPAIAPISDAHVAGVAVPHRPPNVVPVAPPGNHVAPNAARDLAHLSTRTVVGGEKKLSDVAAAAAAAAAAAPVAAPGSLPQVRLNIPEAEVKEGVSLAAVCMGRHQTLAKTAPAWLSVKDVNEVILVDWSSDPPLEETVRSIPGGERIKIIRVNDEPIWVLSRAYNLALNATSYTHVIRTDCDYKVGQNFVAAHKKLLEANSGAAVGDTDDGKHFYAGNYNLARNENEVHLNGAVFIKRKDFLDIGGYDERIQTYGWDDEDLYNRLDAAGLKKMNISYDHVSHVKHDDSGRAQTGVKFATVEIDLNSLLLSKLKAWSRNVPMATRYDNVPGAHSSSNAISIHAAVRPKSLRQLVTTKQYEEAWGEALGRRLHDSYFVPWDIISTLNIHHKELLLRRIMGRMENREAMKRAELDAAGRKDEIVNIDMLPTPRLLVCHCMHGLGNRLRALGSCMSFAKESSRELVVVWQPDSHIEAKFSEMFSNKLVVMEKMPVQWPFTDVQKWDNVWSHFKFHNYMEMEGNGAVKGERITDIPNKHMYYKGAYIMEAVNTELTNWDKDNNMLRSLTPIPEVATMVKSLEARGLGTENVIGLHVRNRTLEKDIKNVNFVKEYGQEATDTMDMWRHKSGVQNFIKLINSIITEKPNIKFFVATDTFEVIGQLEKLYPDRILSFKRTCDDRDGQCVRFALADVYALSKCKELYGSNWSSFTEAAERIGGIKAKLAGQDFGV